MNVLGSEQEEQKVITLQKCFNLIFKKNFFFLNVFFYMYIFMQEEITKPLEKKRNSRRVSFATTNNVRVFTK